MVDAPLCKVCSQTLTGLDTVFDDSGAGVVVTRCPRCHNYSHHLDMVAISAFRKQAGVLDGVGRALKEIGPAVAAAGIWDLMVAYDTFKKVLKNTVRLQEKQSPLYNPFWATGHRELNKAASVQKKADEEGFSDENHAYKPSEDQNVESFANPGTFHFEDEEDAREVKVALSEIQNFLQAVIPHVVAYAMEKQDPEVLRAL
jgi:hypothetical protein